MSRTPKAGPNRRQLLRLLARSAAGAYATAALPGCTTSVRSGGRPGLAAVGADATDKTPKYLIVITATGGASLIDSFLAIRHSETANWQAINCFPDAQVKSFDDSPLRAVDLTLPSVGPIPMPLKTSQSTFVSKHKADMMVVTATVTSVNHTIAQNRTLTGNNAWNGRTLQECVAAQNGAGSILPNLNMGAMGYAQNGIDPSLPASASAEIVANPSYLALGLHGSKGLKNAPPQNLIDLARDTRGGALEPASGFLSAHPGSAALARWTRQRTAAVQLETMALIDRLIAIPDSPQFPLSQFGLTPTPEVAALTSQFPSLATDPLEAQAALAYLTLTNGISSAVTLGPTFDAVINGGATVNAYGGGTVPAAGATKLDLVNTPLGFDFSHVSHRATQAFMWDRVLGVIDRLATLLKAKPADATSGESFWDRTLVYVATDFGREKIRTGGSETFGTGHHLNNGYLIVSPLANGNQVLGGVDKDTALTYGFDPSTGAPAPGRTMTEAEIFAGILQALDVDTAGSGLPDVPAMRRS